MKRHRTVTISDGTKLREVRTETGTSTAIDWCGDLVLEKVGSGTKAAKRLRLDGGYVDLTSSTPAKRHFVRDHLGSIRAVVDDTGTSLETDDYYPLGGPLPTGTTIQPEKYQGKEWNTAAGFNVYDFGARLYDPGLGRWLSQDPMAEQYYYHSPYLFCAGNPMKFVDPEGKSTRVRRLQDGTFQVIGGNIFDNDFGIYVGEIDENGIWTQYENAPIGYTPTLFSFYDSDSLDEDRWRVGSIIDANDNMGISFLSEIAAGVGLLKYLDKARANHQWDVKRTNNTDKIIEGINPYRGMPIGIRSGLPLYASARDVGNIAAGMVAGAHGLSWPTARCGFDIYQSFQAGYASTEGKSTRSAEKYGWNIGRLNWLDAVGRLNKKSYYAY